MDLDNDRLVLDVSRSEWDVLIEIQQSLMLLPGGRLRASINLMVSGQFLEKETSFVDLIL